MFLAFAHSMNACVWFPTSEILSHFQKQNILQRRIFDVTTIQNGRSNKRNKNILTLAFSCFFGQLVVVVAMHRKLIIVTFPMQMVKLMLHDLCW